MKVPSTKSEIVQTERKAKEKCFFFCFSEVQPIFGEVRGTIKREKYKTNHRKDQWGIKKPLSTVKKGRIMKKLGYRTKRLKGFTKYHVYELQYLDIQQNRNRELAELDSRPF